MALMTTPYMREGWQAADFELKGTDEKIYRLADVRGSRGLVVMFICNHCPYVIAIADRLAPTFERLAAKDIGAVAIMSNDTRNYPADSFPKMKTFALQHQFSFPYCIDEDQSVARAYEAVCTPDFFGFDANLQLRYRGRLDSAGKGSATADTVPELELAMAAIAAQGSYNNKSYPSVGCSIKWK
jgi:peroxiredoxin